MRAPRVVRLSVDKGICRVVLVALKQRNNQSAQLASGGEHSSEQCSVPWETELDEVKNTGTVRDELSPSKRYHECSKRDKHNSDEKKVAPSIGRVASLAFDRFTRAVCLGRPELEQLLVDSLGHASLELGAVT